MRVFISFTAAATESLETKRKVGRRFGVQTEQLTHILKKSVELKQEIVLLTVKEKAASELSSTFAPFPLLHERPAVVKR